MPAIQQHFIQTGYLSSVAGEVDAGKALVLDTAGTRLLIATSANRAAANRQTSCISLTAGDGDYNIAVEVQFGGMVGRNIVNLGDGDEDTVYVNSSGDLARGGDPETDDIVGRCDADGTVYLLCGGVLGITGVGGGGGEEGGGEDLETDFSARVHSLDEENHTTEGPHTIGDTFEIPTNSRVIVTAICTFQQFSSHRSTTFYVRREFHNKNDVVYETVQEDTLDAETLPEGSFFPVEIAIARTVNTGRIEATCIDDLEIKVIVDRWITTVLSEPSTADPPVLTSISHDVWDPLGGGQTITIVGTDLAGADYTLEGYGLLTLLTSTSTGCTFAAPVMDVGTYEITAETVGGTSDPIEIEVWTPAGITSVTSWFDSRRGLSGSTPDDWVEQTVPFTWVDAGTVGSDPTRETDFFGTDVPSLRFGSGNQRYQRGANINLLTANSVFWVGSWTSSYATPPAGNGGVPRALISEASGSMSAGGYGTGLGYHRNNGGHTIVDTTDVHTGGTALNDGTTRLVGVTHGSGTINFYVGHTLAKTASLTYPSGTPRYSAVGANQNTTLNGIDADLGAIVIVNAVISSDDLQKLHTWAQQSFGAA